MSRFPVLRAVERANQLVSPRLSRELGPAGLTDIEAQLLFHLDHLPAGARPAVRELKSAFGLPPTTLTAVIDRLERKALVKRAINPSDRRSMLVVPTALGRRRIAQISEVLSRIESSAAAAIGPQDMAAFQRVLEALERSTTR